VASRIRTVLARATGQLSTKNYDGFQAFAPRLLKGLLAVGRRAEAPTFILALLIALIAAGVSPGASPWIIVVAGLALFGLIFAVNSSVHSFLVLAYTESEQIGLNVGCSHSANAAGRLLGTSSSPPCCRSVCRVVETFPVFFLMCWDKRPGFQAG